MALGNYERAFTLYRQALVLLEKFAPNKEEVGLILAGLASIARVGGQIERAVILLGAAERGISEYQSDPYSSFRPSLAIYESEMITLCEQMSEIAFDQARAVGKGMSNAEAIRYALETDPPLPQLLQVEQRHTPPPLDDPLTSRELEILRLIAQGLTNQEIADHLVLAASTVKWYAHVIFGKLYVTNRMQAVVRAREQGLIPSTEL